MNRLLREPLVHFLLLGAALFWIHAVVSGSRGAPNEAVVVSAGQLESLAETFARVWQRPPTASEMKGLIDEYVKEEILSREAVKLGLDRNDPIIRRRLQQKMEFVTDDLLADEEPTEAVLAAYLAEHPEAFRQDERLTFRQVFLSADKRGDRLDADAARLLGALKTNRATPNVAELGDPTLLPHALTDEPERGVRNTFGPEFSDGLSKAATGEWTGPIRSGFGLHLVRVERRTGGHLPELAEVRDAVRREWEHARRTEASRRFYEGLRKQYRVDVEWPGAGSEKPTVTR